MRMTDDVKRTLASNLKHIRKDILKMSLTQASKALNIKYETLRSYERASSAIPSHILYKVSNLNQSYTIPYELFFMNLNEYQSEEAFRLSSKFKTLLLQAQKYPELLKILNADLENQLRIVGLYLSISRKNRVTAT